MKSSVFAVFAVSAVSAFFLRDVILASARPSSDLKTRLHAVDRVFSQRLLGGEATQSQHSSSLTQKSQARVMFKQQKRFKVQTPRDVIVETEDDRAALNQLLSRLMKRETHDKEGNDEDEAKIKKTMSKIKLKFGILNHVLNGGFDKFESKVKNFFQGKD